MSDPGPGGRPQEADPETEEGESQAKTLKVYRLYSDIGNHCHLPGNKARVFRVDGKI